jgi:hypothetical protein
VKNDYGTEYEAWVLNGLEEPLKKNLISNVRHVVSEGF